MRHFGLTAPRRRRRGNTVIETVMLLPLWLALLVLVVMMLNFAIAYCETTMVAQAAVREAAQEYDPLLRNTATARAVARGKCDDEGERLGFLLSRMTCDLSTEDIPLPGSDASDARRVLAVTVSYDYHFNALGFQTLQPQTFARINLTSTMYAPVEYTGGEMR